MIGLEPCPFGIFFERVRLMKNISGEGDNDERHC